MSTNERSFSSISFAEWIFGIVGISILLNVLPDVHRYIASAAFVATRSVTTTVVDPSHASPLALLAVSAAAALIVAFPKAALRNLRALAPVIALIAVFLISASIFNPTSGKSANANAAAATSQAHSHDPLLRTK
jgi:hypothetical protein